MLVLLVLRHVVDISSWSDPTFGGHSNTIDLGLLYKDKLGGRRGKKKIIMTLTSGPQSKELKNPWLQ